jgi:hypothetical protein
MFGSRLKNGMARADELAKIGHQHIEIGRDRQKQFRNRAHNTSLMGRF